MSPSVSEMEEIYIYIPLVHVPLVEFMYLVFTRMPGGSYRRRLRSLFCLCDVFRAPVNSLVCLFERLIPDPRGSAIGPTAAAVVHKKYSHFTEVNPEESRQYSLHFRSVSSVSRH